MNPILEDRLVEVLERKSLAKGNHSPDGVMCVMEAAAYIANEPWSDAPQCVCPVITKFMVNWNDSLPNDAERDRLLKPLLQGIIGTRSTRKVELRRSYMALDWFIRDHIPAWFDLTPALKPSGDALRAADEIVSKETLAAVRPLLEAGKKEAVAAWDAAWAAAGAAARDAAWAAARDAAWAAAGAAAGDAARDAAWDALTSTREHLQLSAQNLVRRMCAVKP